jgi:hypothetical protein
MLDGIARSTSLSRADDPQGGTPAERGVPLKRFRSGWVELARHDSLPVSEVVFHSAIAALSKQWKISPLNIVPQHAAGAAVLDLVRCCATINRLNGDSEPKGLKRNTRGDGDCIFYIVSQRRWKAQRPNIKGAPGNVIDTTRRISWRLVPTDHISQAG